VTDDASGPGAAVVVVVLSQLLTAAELLRGISIVDPHAAISIPLRRSDVPSDLAVVVRAAWAFAVGSDGSGPGAPVVIEALTRALTLAELMRRYGVDPREAIAVPLQCSDIPRGLKFVAWGAWAFAVGLDDAHERLDDAHERLEAAAE
jgi:hypothetical protein